MTVVEQTLIEQQTDLLEQINTLTIGHPAGPFVRLLLAPAQLPLESDEMLIQVPDPDRREMRLVPRKVADITPGDILHDLQILNPGDTASVDYAKDGHTAGYTIINERHWMSNR